MKARHLAGWSLAIMTVVMTEMGCGTTHDQLVVANSTNRVDVDVENAARVHSEGITMTAQADAWPGSEDLESKVTPVYLIIENHSGAPLRVEYERVAFVSDDGERFSALPPTNIHGRVERPVAEHPTARLRPSGAARRYEFSGSAGDNTVYTGLPTDDGVFFYDAHYYDQYYTAWQTVSLPTVTMNQPRHARGRAG